MLAVAPSRRLVAQDSVIVIDPDAPATPAAQRTGLDPEVLRRVLARYNDSATTRLEGTILLPAGARLQGPLAVWQGPLRIRGTATGPVVVVNGDLEILEGGRVEGDVLVVGGQLLGDTAGAIGGRVEAYPDAAPVIREDDGTLTLRDRRRPLLTFGGTQRSFQTGKITTTLFLSSGGTYDRVEGLPLTLGPRFRYQMAPDRRASLELLGVIRTAGDPTKLGEEVGYDAHLDFGTGRTNHHAWGFGARASQLVDAIEPQPLGRSEVGWSTLIMHRDYRDYYLNEGVALYGYYWAGSSFRIEGGWRTEDQRSLPANDPWTLFRTADPWRPNPLIDDGRYHTVHLGFTFDTRNEPRLTTSGNWVRVLWERSSSADVAPVGLPATVRAPIPTDGSYAFSHLSFDARSYNRLNPAMRMNLRLVGGGWTGGDPLPLQQRLSLGGPDFLSGYAFREQRCGEGAPADPAQPALCDRSLAFQAELRSHLDLGLLYRYRDRGQVEQAFGLDQVDFVVHADMGKAWLTGDGPGRVPNGRIPSLDEWMYDLGVGIDAGGIGAFLSKALTAGQPVRFFVRLQRRF
ncbi:MAG TPA: hypothetical protein VFI13_03185 [Gemmatimonadales bacterium]|nr:hypothetical protein [Gemmatimonadales bacterium]